MALNISSIHRIAGNEEKRELANALGNSPETALAVHLLRKGNGDAYVAGALPDFHAAIIEDYDVGPELLAFGSDIPAFINILYEMDGWDIVNAPRPIATELSAAIRSQMHLSVHMIDDIYQVPAGVVASFRNPDVRMLTREDIPLLEQTPDDIRDSFEDDLELVFREELVAGAVLPGRIVSIAATYGYQEKYVDVAISTLEEFRGRGYARAAASLIAAKVQEAGRVPIWSCAPTNLSSLAVAAKLGFHEVSRRINIVLDGA
ncbi:MAG TPA: GNAT family N-acetyltransferase [Anaerolineales bacterium]|nr:GNAT family N-acetyltransferase [Anaerolineales bacterium]